MKDCLKKLVSRRSAFVTFIVALVAVAVYAQQTGYYSFTFGPFNCLVPPGQSAVQTKTGNAPANAVITSIVLNGNKSAGTAPTTCATVYWVVRHVANNVTHRIPFNPNGVTTNLFNGLPANTQWEVWIECGPPPAGCVVATINSGSMRVNWRVN